MNYRHLNINDRKCIQLGIKNGDTYTKIANDIGRSVSTVQREIKRNSTNGIYYPNEAQTNYERNREKCVRSLKLSLELINKIVSCILLNWSPEQIVGRLNLEGEFDRIPCYSTIYNLIRSKKLPKITVKHLRHKGRRSENFETRGKFNDRGRIIYKRPKDVYRRSNIGHWEGDTVESGRIDHIRKSSCHFVTLAERKSRKYLAYLVPNKRAKVVKEAIVKLLKNQEVKTITFDRGKEFAEYLEIEKELNCNTYFANPHAPWQKGTNENTNGLLREFYPKGMDLSKTTQKELDYYIDLLNNRPRKCLGYRTPNEVYDLEVKK